jgi:hypothetical protein
MSSYDYSACVSVYGFKSREIPFPKDGIQKFDVLTYKGPKNERARLLGLQYGKEYMVESYHEIFESTVPGDVCPYYFYRFRDINSFRGGHFDFYVGSHSESGEYSPSYFEFLYTKKPFVIQNRIESLVSSVNDLIKDVESIDIELKLNTKVVLNSLEQIKAQIKSL